jgi:hypothetical protein
MFAFKFNLRRYIVEHAQLNDRRRVLAKDAAGAVSMWDVTKCARVREYPPGADFAATLEAENAVPVSVPGWFQARALHSSTSQLNLSRF